MSIFKLVILGDNLCWIKNAMVLFLSLSFLFSSANGEEISLIQGSETPILFDLPEPTPLPELAKGLPTIPPPPINIFYPFAGIIFSIFFALFLFNSKIPSQPPHRERFFVFYLLLFWIFFSISPYLSFLIDFKANLEFYGLKAEAKREKSTDPNLYKFIQWAKRIIPEGENVRFFAPTIHDRSKAAYLLYPTNIYCLLSDEPRPRYIMVYKRYIPEDLIIKEQAKSGNGIRQYRVIAQLTSRKYILEIAED